MIRTRGGRRLLLVIAGRQHKPLRLLSPICIGLPLQAPFRMIGTVAGRPLTALFCHMALPSSCQNLVNKSIYTSKQRKSLIVHANMAIIFGRHSCLALYYFAVLLRSCAFCTCPAAGIVGFCSGITPSLQNSTSNPCRDSCALNFFDSSCPFGNGSASLPCGLYTCVDIYGGTRFCNPVTDFPVKNFATSDVLGCDSGPSWGQMKCTSTSQTYFRNDTCPWVDNITMWSSIPGLQQCVDSTTCSVSDSGPSCCNSHGGKLRCPIDAPYMCAADDQCADGLDRCCLPSARLCQTSAMGGQRPCNVSFQRVVTSCALDSCTPSDTPSAASAAAQTCSNLSQRLSVFPATGSSYQEALYLYGVDLKCLSCLRAGCGYCQVPRRADWPPPSESGQSKGSNTKKAGKGRGGEGEEAERTSARIRESVNP